ncbi:MAG: M48 family metalloprotease [Polyangiaceae bacterium]|nr:M48 family metalloprotease [Myxococcales bacterium]MCB9584525.1 M48 family metalloprotease [Polyangiaceae bacterium]
MNRIPQSPNSRLQTQGLHPLQKPPGIWGRRLFYRAQTWGILALIALVSGVSGYLVLGSWGAVLLLLLVVGSFGALRVAPGDLVLRLQGGRELSYHERPELFEAVWELSRRAGLPVAPRLFLMPMPGVQAMSTGSLRRPALGITRGLLWHMEPRELFAILAHEVAHVSHGDMATLGLVQALLRVTRLSALIGFLAVVANLLAALLGMQLVPAWIVWGLLIAPALVTLLTFALSRVREFEADLGAAELSGDPAALASALLRLEALSARLAPPWLRLELPSWLRTHPDTRERVRLLAELAPTPLRAPVARRGRQSFPPGYQFRFH